MKHVQEHLFVIVQSLINDGLEEVLNYCKRENLEITETELIECFKTAIETLKKDPEMN